MVLGLSVVIGDAKGKAAGHEAGLVRYARVDRPDGAYREMLVDPAMLERLRQGQSPDEGATPLMESYYQPGVVGSVFVKRKLDGARLVKKTIFVGVFAYLIGNWNGLARIVFDSFAGLGLMASQPMSWRPPTR